MPNRIIREAILSSSRVAALNWQEEVFYRRLMSVVDDYGRCEANQQLLRARCYPLQTDLVRVADISRWMAACQKAGLILVYVVNGKQYLEVLNFQQQQRSASKCPSPPSHDINCEQVIANAHLDVGVSVVVDGGVDDSARGAPVGVRPEVWSAWRKARGKKLTADAVRLQAKFLAEQGGDPNAIIEQSIRNGWAGLFPLKQAAMAGGKSMHDKRAATAAAMFGPLGAVNDEPNDITAESTRVA